MIVTMTSYATGHNSVIGYVAIRFEPEVLRVPVGSSAIGNVHVTVHVTSAMTNRPVLGIPQQLRRTLNISACSVDPEVADVTWWPSSEHQHSRNDDDETGGTIASCIDQRHHKMRPSGHVIVSMTSSTFALSVRGFRLGRTRIKFYVIRTQRRHTIVASSFLPAATTRTANYSQQIGDSGYDAFMYVPVNDAPGVAGVARSESDTDRQAEAEAPFVPDISTSSTDPNMSTESLKYTANSYPAVTNGSTAAADSSSVVQRSNAEPVKLADAGGYSPAVWNASGTATMRDTVAVGGGHDYDGDVELWWIAHDYEIRVVNDVKRSTASALRYAVLALTAVNLVGIGAQLEWSEVLVNVRQPSPLFVGLFNRQAVMPTVSSQAHEHFIERSNSAG